MLFSAGATSLHEHRLSPEVGIALQVPFKDPSEAVQGHRDCPALSALALWGKRFVADYLRGLGASIGQTDLNGETLLHKAAESGCLPTIHYLLDEGLDPNRAKGESGESPLHYAVRARRVEAVPALLGRGANPNVLDRFAGEIRRWSEAPLDIAKSPEIRSLLIARGAREASRPVGGDSG